MTFQRRPDWEDRMNAVFERYRTRGFGYGTADCCQFSADVVKAMTGRDPMKPFRGRYRSREGAARALREIGKGTLRATLEAILGAPVPPMCARRGDVLWDGENLGVCNGLDGLFVSDSGLVSKRTAGCVCAFRIG